MKRARRIGPQMAFLAAHVIEGDSILSLVRRCYTTRRRGYKSIKFGYEAVHRAINAGLIRVLPNSPKGQYRLAKAKVTS